MYIEIKNVHTTTWYKRMCSWKDRSMLLLFLSRL